MPHPPYVERFGLPILLHFILFHAISFQAAANTCEGLKGKGFERVSQDASLEYLHAQLAGAGHFVFRKLCIGRRKALSREPRQVHGCGYVH